MGNTPYEVFINVIGWMGSLEVLVAYGLNSVGKIPAKSAVYQILNFTGSVFLIINTIFYHAFPSAFLNVAWAAIAIFAMSQIFSRRNHK